MKKIAVVILNWNGKKLLEQFLPAIIEHSPEADVYVADNASTDDSMSFVKQHFPTITIIQNTTNFGFAQGYNEALQHVDADYFALVNSDIEVTANWLKPVLDIFENQPQTAIIQPKIIDYKNKEYFEYAGAAGGFIDQYGYPFCRGRIFETIEKDLQQYNDACRIFWASGACFFIRRDVFRALHGFDADFFAHQEEIDLCWRAFNKNYEIRYAPQSVVYHVGGATLDHGNPRKTYLNFRNSLLMLLKNLPASSLIPILLMRMLLDGLAAIQFLLKGKLLHSMAIMNAHFSFYSMLSKTYKKRDTVQLKNYYKINSIVYQYFVKKSRLFGDIF